MKEIIKRGIEIKYIHKCNKCGAIFSYMYLDTYRKIEDASKGNKEQTKPAQNTPILEPIGFPIMPTQLIAQMWNDYSIAMIKSACCVPYNIDKQKNEPHNKDKYCMCPQCGEENEVNFKKKTIINLIKMVIH